MTDGRVEVRHAVAADLARIAELFGQLGYPTEVDELERRWSTVSSDEDSAVLVASDSRGVNGVLVLNVIAPLHVGTRWAVISALVVDLSIRSTGAGAVLLARAERESRIRGCGHIELACSERRTRAHAFYMAQGFIEVRKRFVKKLADGKT